MFNWQQLQTALNAEKRSFVDVGSTDTLSTPLCFPLDDYRIVTVTGENAATFLQGQCTCNFMTLGDHGSTYGSHCTPKGRMVASFIAKQISTGNSDTLTIGLRVHKSCAEILQQSLSKYAVFSKVKVEITENLNAIAFLGANKDTLERVLKIGIEASEDKTCATIFEHDGTLIELWLSNVILGLGDASHAVTKELIPKQAQENTLLSSIAIGDNTSWELLQIRRGVYAVRGETSGELLPQEINHQLLGAIDFKKGCYTGQEIIARLHYKGQLKKHMRRSEITFDGALPKAIADTNGFITRESVFEIIPKNLIGLPLSAVTVGSKIEMLSVVNDAILEQTEDVNEIHSSAKISWLPLPYAIP